MCRAATSSGPPAVAAEARPWTSACSSIEYANAVVSRATPGDKSTRRLFDDGDSGHRKRKGVHGRLPEKLIETAPVRELLPWLGWVDAITGLEGKIRRTFETLDGWLDVCGGGDDDHRNFVDVARSA